ncbi:helix-turn-helix domain-containing protein [Agromyces sp. NPDC049794]|uniref:AraC family transcriptional regulator n=1 Tax=unclassified Agromyces TaxID=2639701 RepID=UPI0033F68282
MSGVRRTSMSLRDPDAVERSLTDSFPAIRYGRADLETFHVSVDVAEADRFSMAELAWDVGGTATTGATGLTVVSIAGRFDGVHGREAVDIRHPFLAPAEGMDARWEAHRATVVALDHRAVERIARAATGNGELRIRGSGTAPLSPELAAYWSMTVRGIRNSIDATPDLFAQPMIATATFHQLATAFLHVFPTNWLETGEGRTGGSVVVRRAIDFMREHIGEPITMTDVAAAAFVSTRGLHAAFTRERGETPMQYLRRIRLDAIRSELLARGSEVTVAAVARRWGFAHLPRFADQYRREFGERPSDTLRR